MENSNSPGFTFDLPKGNSSIIKVIGVGGGGNNALKHMYEKGIYGVDFIICNTDAQTLDSNPVANKVQLGVAITEGLGAGADPEVGEKAAIESIDEIKAALGQNTKMVFITAGMGGGTGTGAAPVVAKIAKEMGILTVGIVTVPFGFEGKRRLEQAENGLEKLRNNVDSLIVINNDKLRQQFGNLGFKQGFSKADEVLTNAAKGMAEVITAPFQINIDFRDAKSVLENSGTALMSTGIATGEKRAEEAVRKALDSPLLNDNKITGAKDVLLLILSGSDEASEATLDEIGLINDYVQSEAGGNNNANIIFGVGTDEELGDAIKVLVIATGFAKDNVKNQAPSERIRFSLNDSEKIERESPFKTSANRAEEPKRNIEELGGKQFFRLDDEDEQPTPQFRSSDQEKKMTFGTDSDQQTVISENFTQKIPKTDAKSAESADLFSYKNDHDLEPQGFSFETENSVKKENEEYFSSEKPVEFFFGKEEKPEVDFGVREEKPEADPVFFPETKSDFSEAIPESKTDFPESKTQIPETPETVKEVPEFAQKQAFEFSGEEEFTFITKKPENTDAKVLDRRNKLKEFNSRYQVSDENLEFENVPAYKRKNIAIEGGNASENQISSYYSEKENGQVQIRENRFLNRDVD